MREEHGHSVGALICEAIRGRRRLVFDYGGHHRVVEPYCHGTSTAGSEVLRAVQIAGGSASSIIGTGKLWTVAKMRNVRLDAVFVPDDPLYNPNDSAMAVIHCRI